MTLGEALKNRYWMADPWNDKVARVCGPDDKVSFIVEKTDDGFDCWLRCSKNGERLGEVRHIGDPSEVEGALEHLTHLREMAGDCPLCRLPMAIDGEAIRCVCGYEAAVGVEMEVVHE